MSKHYDMKLTILKVISDHHREKKRKRKRKKSKKKSNNEEEDPKDVHVLIARAYDYIT